MSYNDTNCGHTGWGVGLSAIIGGALGYWAGRSSGPGGFGGCGAVRLSGRVCCSRLERALFDMLRAGVLSPARLSQV